MNKKAQFTDMVISYIPKMIAIGIVFITIVFFVNRFILTKLDVQDIEASLLTDRMIYSKNCISYVDESISRPYPGIIDYDKFKSENLNKCIFYGGEDKEILSEDCSDISEFKNKFSSAKVELKYIENSKEETVTIYHNKCFYDAWLPLAGISGPGGTKSYKESNYVLIRKSGKLLPGKISFDMILPNS
jgi:hypothetical protein